MAVPYYNVGTATLTAGLTAMVGQGTLWAGNVRPGDQVVSYGGQTAIVDTVNSNTSITLTRAFRGTSQTAADYEIIYTPDDPFTQTLARQVFQTISGSALVGLGNLVPAARKLPFFDATSAAALADLSDFARSRLAETSGTSWLTALGAQSQFSGLAIAGGDYNNAVVDGIYNGAGGSAVNGPPSPASYGPCWVGTRGSSNPQIVQIAAYASGSGSGLWSFYMRGKDAASAWSAWRPFVETYASVANGSFVRLPGGVQICWQRWSVTDQAIASAYGSSGMFTGSRSWTFPAAFAAPPVANCSEFKWGTSASFGGIGAAPTTTGAVLYGYDFFSRATGTTTTISAIAVGMGA